MQAPEETDIVQRSARSAGLQRRGWLVTLVVVIGAVVLCAVLWLTIGNRASQEKKVEEKETTEPANTVDVNQSEANVKLAVASSRTPSAKIKVVGTVEANEQQMQQVSALAGGRVEKVAVALGDHVSKGMLLVEIDSPQVAELHGKLHEAETKLKLSQLTFTRVKQAANKVSILKAKATLDEAVATLKRTKQLVSEGLTARKDLVAAESEFERATADYNFQKDISFNRELADAAANVQTSETEVVHIRDSLKALDAQLPSREENEHSISTLQLRAPITGVVLERLVNPGAGVEAGKPLLTIVNTSSVWVIASVPEKEMRWIRLNIPVQVYLDNQVIAGHVSYIDPRLNEDTRTARVRIIVDNSQNQIQVGSFAEVEFSNPRKSASGAVFVPATSVQTVEDKPVVFVKTKDGSYKVRPVRVGEEVNEMIPVYDGLSEGESVAADGSFILKSKLLKGQLGDED